MSLLKVLFFGLLLFALAPAANANMASLSTSQGNTVTTTLASQGKQKKVKKHRVLRTLLKWYKKADDNEGIIAAVICFFLGGLGIHRVYLNSEPIIILWYLITLGGIFGLIPLIDFIRLIIGHVDHYRENNDLFAAFK